METKFKIVARHETYIRDLVILCALGIISSGVEFIVYAVCELELVAYIYAFFLVTLIWKIKQKFLPVSYRFTLNDNVIHFSQRGQWDSHFPTEVIAKEYELISSARSKNGVLLKFKEPGCSGLSYELILYNSQFGCKALSMLLRFLQARSSYKPRTNFHIGYTANTFVFRHDFFEKLSIKYIFKPTLAPIFLVAALATYGAIWFINYVYGVGLWYSW